MARRRILATISGLLVSIPLALAPTPAAAAQGGQALSPVGQVQTQRLAHSGATRHSHSVGLPALPSDPAALKAAKARAEGKRNLLLAATPCTAVTQTVSPASPQAPGTSVTFTASATGCSSPNYEFWLQAPGGGWTVVQSYGATASWTWSTGGLATGTYNEDVYARDASSTASYDTYLSPDPTYTLQVSACTAVTQTATPASPQTPGTTVTFSAAATGCPNPQYEFWLLAPGGSWTVTQGYSSSSTWAWNTGGLATGTYTEDVYARDAASTATYDTYLSPDPTYTLQATIVTPCTSVSESATPASPQPAGTNVTFTASAAGCPNPNYEFWLLAPGSSWTIVQAYSSSATWTWSTAGLPAGTYTLDVYARDASSTASFDAHLSPNPTYTLQAPATFTCTSVTESANPASPQSPGTTVTFTATGSGCPNPTYEFWLLPPNGSWSIVQAYGAANTWTWSTGGLATGTYSLDVYVRDATSSAAFDAHLSPNPTYTLQVVVTPCTSVSVSPSPAAPQTPGTSVTFTATAAGCPRPNYEFWLQPPGGSWSVVQSYSTSTTWTWNTSGLATGTYTLDVYARDASSSAAYDAHISPNPTYALSAGPACTAVAETATPPSQANPGTAVTFTASASGCPSPTYEFWLQPPGGTWAVTQAFSTSATWTWSTAGLAPGTYTLDVYARQNGSSASYEAHLSPNPTFRLAPGWNGTDAPGVSAADEAFCCVPPDTTGAIGQTYYVEIINNTIAVYDRHLNLVATTDLGSFSNAGSLNVSDPNVQWDPRSGRWYYSLVGFTSDFSTTVVLFGWSMTSDPTNLTSGWCRFSAGSPMLPDYPKLGHDDNFILIGANLYDAVQSTQPFITGQIFAIPKPRSGDTSCTAPAAYIFADSKHPLKNADGTLAFTPVPANTVDASQGGFIVAAHSPTLAPLGPQTRIMTWHVSKQSSGVPALNPDGDLTVNSFDVPAGVPQPGGGPLIDSLDGRLTQAVAHADPAAGGAEAVWTQHTINGPGGRSVVRWYELLPATHLVRQQGQVSDPVDYVFNGAISPSISGNDAVVFYDRGGSAESPLVAGQGRSAGAPLGTLDSGETILVTSTGADGDFSCSSPYGPPCRWGDYAGASPDPSNPGVVWGTDEWSGPSSFGFPGWGTQNFALAS